ncbi:hypothetical protein BKA65DRAFT_486270 [Rhexocercosporidium sp. MPI-PUGE-AT-0058]|nr:hypothetical protein BKA65DRAFT_486270 [Rhexocercosporidium sp. MPI-PUGE-AT-0058]
MEVELPPIMGYNPSKLQSSCRFNWTPSQNSVFQQYAAKYPTSFGRRQNIPQLITQLGFDDYRGVTTKHGNSVIRIISDKVLSKALRIAPLAKPVKTTKPRNDSSIAKIKEKSVPPPSIDSLNEVMATIDRLASQIKSQASPRPKTKKKQSAQVHNTASNLTDDGETGDVYPANFTAASTGALNHNAFMHGGLGDVESSEAVNFYLTPTDGDTPLALAQTTIENVKEAATPPSGGAFVAGQIPSPHGLMHGRAISTTTNSKNAANRAHNTMALSGYYIQPHRLNNEVETGTPSIGQTPDIGLHQMKLNYSSPSYQSGVADAYPSANTNNALAETTVPSTDGVANEAIKSRKKQDEVPTQGHRQTRSTSSPSSARASGYVIGQRNSTEPGLAQSKFAPSSFPSQPATTLNPAPKPAQMTPQVHFTPPGPSIVTEPGAVVTTRAARASTRRKPQTTTTIPSKPSQKSNPKAQPRYTAEVASLSANILLMKQLFEQLATEVTTKDKKETGFQPMDRFPTPADSGDEWVEEAPALASGSVSSSSSVSSDSEEESWTDDKGGISDVEDFYDEN